MQFSGQLKDEPDQEHVKTLQKSRKDLLNVADSFEGDFLRPRCISEGFVEALLSPPINLLLHLLDMNCIAM